MRHWLPVGLLIWLLLLAACSQPTNNTTISNQAGDDATPAVAQELVVFSVAPFAEAFADLGAKFRAEYPEITVTFNFAGGPQLAQQMSEGATIDLLAFNKQLLPRFVQTGRVISGTEQLFTRTQPIVVVPASNPAQITTLADLATPDTRIVFGSEETAIGQYSLRLLEKAAQTSDLGTAYRDAVLNNVVSYETSVRAVLAKVIVGEADAAIVYASDVVGADADQVEQIELPEALTTVANFYLVIPSDTTQAELAQQFIDYARSDVGQRVLEEYGFLGNLTAGQGNE